MTNHVPITEGLSYHARHDMRQALYEASRRAFQADPRHGYPRIIKRMENKDR